MEESIRNSQSAFRNPRHPFLRAFPPVLVTYGLAALGLYLWPSRMLASIKQEPVPVWIGLPVIFLFTATHAVMPVFFYRRFVLLASLLHSGCVTAFIYAHIGFWYGVPALIVAGMTGWLSLAGAAAHVALAPRGARLWTFFQYGSTSVALLLFLAIFATRPDAVPLAMAAVAGQSVLLTIMEVKAKPGWMEGAGVGDKVEKALEMIRDLKENAEGKRQ